MQKWLCSSLSDSVLYISNFITDIDLDINALQDGDKEFYVAESRDMVTIIQSLLRAGKILFVPTKGELNTKEWILRLKLTLLTLLLDTS